MNEDILQRLSDALADRYRLKREVGRGGAAVVFVAEDLQHGRPVAIKVIRPEVAGSLGHERFLREIQVAARLTHPHIVPLFDSGEADGLLYYVMPFVKGETLKDRLERSGALDLDEALRIAREVADALAYAHGHGLVHRDIKPENIMLSSGHAVVADFGICRAMDEAGGDGLTQTGLTLGTPAYMSPEQWSDPDKVDGRSDIYSLGCVLYEMLTGETPFQGSTAHALMARHAQQEVPSPRIVRPDLPQEVEAVIRWALAKVPDERAPSAFEFADALAEATRSSRSTPTGSSSASQTSGWDRRTVTSAIVMGLIFPALFGIYLFATNGDTEVPEDRVRIVVLPFDNLDQAAADHLVDGITEDITSRLSGIEGLGVIAQSSAMEYRGRNGGIREIGEELNVAYIVEGSVRCNCVPSNGIRPDDTLRVTARLTQVSDQTQLWGSDFNVPLGDVFSVQGDIAQEVATRLNLSLGDTERSRLAAQPTGDMEAYEFYLRGNDYYGRSWERADVEAAIELYERALALDPEFAPAAARLGQAHAWMYRLRHDVSQDRLTQARDAVERALEIDPDLAEAHVALGLYHYWGRWDYERAMDALLEARRLKPGSALVARQIGNVRRRQGAWPEALESYRRAAELDPRSHIAWFNLADTYAFVREYDEARRYLDRVLSLAPNFFDVHLQRAYVAVWDRGDVQEAGRIMDQLERRVPPSEWRSLYGFWLMGFQRIVLPDLLDRDDAVPGRYGLDSTTYYLAHSDLAERRGDAEQAYAYADSARAWIEPRLDEADEANILIGQLALAYAGMGRHDEAVESARQAVEANAHDAFDGSDWLINLARVLVMAGEHESAIDQLELALAIPTRISPQWLRLDPVWEPLSDHPDFQRLLESRPATVAQED